MSGPHRAFAGPRPRCRCRGAPVTGARTCESRRGRPAHGLQAATHERWGARGACPAGHKGGARGGAEDARRAGWGQQRLPTGGTDGVARGRDSDGRHARAESRELVCFGHRRSREVDDGPPKKSKKNICRFSIQLSTSYSLHVDFWTSYFLAPPHSRPNYDGPKHLLSFLVLLCTVLCVLCPRSRHNPTRVGLNAVVINKKPRLPG